MENEDIKIEPEEHGLQEKLKKLKDELEKCRKEKEEYLAGWQRAKADFINARKDEEKQRAEFAKFANQLLVYDLLTILDSFDLALTTCKEKGFRLIKLQLDDVLKKYGVKAIKSVGEKFDPTLHEAATEEESEKESGTIIEEFQKGYMMHDKILRAAKVKVSK